MPVRRHLEVTSTLIKALGYDHVGNVAEVIFNTSPEVIFRYYNVPAEQFLDLLNADSIGQRWPVYRAQWTHYEKLTRTAAHHRVVICGYQEGEDVCIAPKGHDPAPHTFPTRVTKKKKVPAPPTRPDPMGGVPCDPTIESKGSARCPHTYEGLVCAHRVGHPGQHALVSSLED
jgi:hypothetical protein